MSAATVSLADLAAAAGVPKSTITRRAKAEGWPCEDVPARGGLRRMYEVAGLPADLRAKLLWNTPAARAAQAQVPVVPPELRQAAMAGRAAGVAAQLQARLAERSAQQQREKGLVQVNAMSRKAQRRVDTRLAVLRAFELWHQTEPGAAELPLRQARFAFAVSYNAGGSYVAPDIRTDLPKISSGSLERWHLDLRNHGLAALAGTYGNRAGSSALDANPAMSELVRHLLMSKPHCRYTHVLAVLRARFPGQPVPSVDSLARWIKSWRSTNAEALLLLANPDAWRNKYMTAHGSRSQDVLRVNQRWELDSSPADVMCVDGRHCLVAGIDVKSRMPRILVAKTSKAEAIAALLRRMLLEMGVPEEAKTDNGSDYTSAHVVRVLQSLDVKHTLCEPFNPDQKPHIERFFGTFTRGLAELLPGFIGHSVAERKAIEARRSFAQRLGEERQPIPVSLTGRDLQEFCDDWVQSIYQHTEHQGDGMDGRTPFEVAATLGAQRRVITDERALDLLLAAAPENDGRRTVQKKGIRVDKAWFIAPELHSWVGKLVQVRFDALDHDLGRLFVYGHVEGQGEQEFVCIAECPERSGVDRRAVAAKSRALQRQHALAMRRAMKAHGKRVGTDELVDHVLKDAAIARGKLRLLPTAGTPHTSAGLQAAAKAAQAALPDTRTTADIEDLSAVQAVRARLAAEQAPRAPASTTQPVFETPGQRVQWLLGQARTRALGAEEQEALARYRREQPEAYRRLQDMVAEQLGPATQKNAPAAVPGPGGAS